jgi:AcrR family transcriptional regulator
VRVAQQERGIATREAIVLGGAKVFARLHYSTARVADILEAASVTQGGFYFHFRRGKIEVAEEIIRRQDQGFILLRDSILESGDDGLASLLTLSRSLARAVQHDPTAQAGLRLVAQASSEFPGVAKLPDRVWLDAIALFLEQARAEGNLRAEVDIPTAARAVVYMFTGAQTSSFVSNGWRHLEASLEATHWFSMQALATPEYLATTKNAL